MLNYRDFVYAALADYSAAQTALVMIPEQIETERLRRETLKAQKTDGDRISGSGDRTEDAWLTSISRETYLERRLDECKAVVASVTELLRNLEDDEREIVSRLILTRHRNGTAILAEEWGVDERTVFRAKDRTLKKIARMLTGEARA